MKLHALKMMMLVDLETRDDDFLMISKRRMIASEVGSEGRRTSSGIWETDEEIRPTFDLMSSAFETTGMKGHLFLRISLKSFAAFFRVPFGMSIKVGVKIRRPSWAVLRHLRKVKRCFSNTK